MAWRAPYGSVDEFLPGQRPRARYRNRCYFGGINSATITTNSNGAVVLGAAANTNFPLFMQALSTNNTDLPNEHARWDLVAWSQTDSAVRDAEFYAIGTRIDYQRRRTEQLANENWQPMS
jgi:hypothetical protein